MKRTGDLLGKVATSALPAATAAISGITLAPMGDSLEAHSGHFEPSNFAAANATSEDNDGSSNTPSSASSNTPSSASSATQSAKGSTGSTAQSSGAAAAKKDGDKKEADGDWTTTYVGIGAVSLCCLAGVYGAYRYLSAEEEEDYGDYSAAPKKAKKESKTKKESKASKKASKEAKALKVTKKVTIKGLKDSPRSHKKVKAPIADSTKAFSFETPKQAAGTKTKIISKALAVPLKNGSHVVFFETKLTGPQIKA